MNIKSDSVEAWRDGELDVINVMLSGLNARHPPLVLETYEADDGTPVATFCCCSTGEAFYSLTRINGRYILSNFCGGVVEGSNLYRTMSQMMMPQGWVQAVQRINQR